ncbi:hypothetical protein KHA80_18140 [Anaerobacillus sp. HL2]|nr:hypothetical protein KHA80_18140 [Anaerobacillus sp. HL2]
MPLLLLEMKIIMSNQVPSSWYQRPNKHQFINELKNKGYTVIYSNLFGRNWGSEEACNLIKRLYDEVMKREILNKKVHIIVEGMGAIVAAKLIPTNEIFFRSNCYDKSMFKLTTLF